MFIVLCGVKFAKDLVVTPANSKVKGFMGCGVLKCGVLLRGVVSRYEIECDEMRESGTGKGFDTVSACCCLGCVLCVLLLLLLE